jgi:hypothetical protein
MCEGKDNTCEIPTTNCTLSDHWFCTGCRIEHEAHMATGFLKRADTAGDWYLIPEALNALEQIRKFADQLEDEIRDVDLESDEWMNAEEHEDDFGPGDKASYRTSPEHTQTVDVLESSYTPENGVAYLTRSPYGLHRWVRWSKLVPVEA